MIRVRDKRLGIRVRDKGLGIRIRDKARVGDKGLG